MINVTALPAFADNYIWALRQNNQDTVTGSDNNRVAVVDPGQAEPVLAHLKKHDLRLGAILITHHHPDHTAGIGALLEHADVPVYGPAGENHPIEHLSARLAEGDQVEIDWLGLTLQVLEVPGHTAGHIAFYGDDLLFSGDTLFSGGCGKLFEGDAAQMRNSLEKLRALPGATRIFCGHEYTEKNLLFAQAVEPENEAVKERLHKVREWRADNQPSLPSLLRDEMQFNPFLRWDQPQVIAAACERAGNDNSDPDAVFATVRAWKDDF